MNALDGILEKIDKPFREFATKEAEACENVWKAVEEFANSVKEVLQIYKETGVAPEYNFDDWEHPYIVRPKKDSLKENIEPNEDLSSKGRPRRNAFKEASQNINKLSSISLNTKLRRADNELEYENVNIKKEKMSICNDVEQSGSSNILGIQIKTECEEMPAPTRPAPKKRKQKNNIKQEKVSGEFALKNTEEEPKNTEKSDSDVEVQETTVTTITIGDSDDNEKTIKGNEQNGRSTRTKTKKKKTEKRTRTYSSEDEKMAKTEKKSRSNEHNDLTTQTNDSNEASNFTENNGINNETFVAVNKDVEAASSNMNATVVLENPKYVVNNNLVQVNPEDLLTDDESEDEKKIKNPPKTTTKTATKPLKQVFSPFDPSPVKKKVQAFEKLTEEANAIPVRVTRTKTRAQAKDQDERDDTNIEPKGIVKEKAKFFTPTVSKFIPKAASTMTKINKLTSQNNANESVLTGKSTSAVKAPQTDYIERERKRKEREEAQKKREALLLAQIEEKKRKREEKQLKAQQQREALEKEKLKALEMQRLKDERHKQLIAEQEEKKQRQKEELEKKRMLAKMRAVEEKKREEEKRLEEQRKIDEMSAKLVKQEVDIPKLMQRQKMQKEQRQKVQTVPAYMKTRAPLLPTDDCYDSDDEGYRDQRIREPSWARDENLQHTLFNMIAAGDAIKNSFFSRQAQTPDLQEIFEVIEPVKLKRSSSAIWHKPPRYTMMPDLEQYNEEDEVFYDDDDD